MLKQMGVNQRVECGTGVTLERDVACRLSDGAVLRSDHYYAPGDQPCPTLLMRQPYGRDIASTVVYAHPIWYARHGYNVVIQDVRGRGGSDGSFYPFRHEGKDGAETIAWLRTRAECNGRIGMYGFSYQGATQLLAAAEQPQGLECIAPAMTACDLYRGWFYHNGALRLASSMGWGLQMLKEDARRLDLREASTKLETAWASIRMQPTVMPYAHHSAIADPMLPTYVRDWFEHDAPGDYWSSMDLSRTANKILIPALHVSGWYDIYLEGSIQGFSLLREQAATAHARENQYLLAGPWIHLPWSDGVGDAHLGSEALLDTDALLLRWLDHWLKDADTFSAEPRVRHFALGSNQWCESEACCGAAETVLHLHSGGRAESRKGDGTLTPTPSTQEPPDIFVYDPEVPVVAPGGPLALSGMYDQTAIESGNNVLVYTSEPLAKPVHIFGAPSVILYASTSTPCADLTAKLVRLTADRAEFCCIGIARSTYLFGEDYIPDKIHRWAFKLEPTSYVFAKGDCIRLEIAGCAFPLYDRNPSSLIKPCQMSQWNWKRSTHTIYHDAAHVSALHLPVIA
ncbi:MAG: CocE/NonD family hydrolase [Acidobacteriaceae bacterium]